MKTRCSVFRKLDETKIPLIHYNFTCLPFSRSAVLHLIDKRCKMNETQQIGTDVNTSYRQHSNISSECVRGARAPNCYVSTIICLIIFACFSHSECGVKVSVSFRKSRFIGQLLLLWLAFFPFLYPIFLNEFQNHQKSIIFHWNVISQAALCPFSTHYIVILTKWRNMQRETKIVIYYFDEQTLSIFSFLPQEKPPCNVCGNILRGDHNYDCDYIYVIASP